MSKLEIEGLKASVSDRTVLTGVDLVVGAGEVHAVMGPNGSGKSTLAHVIAGRPNYDVLEGSVRLNGVELLDLPAWRRVEAGLFLTMQVPIEVPGVSLRSLLASSVCMTADTQAGEFSREASARVVDERIKQEAQRIGFDEHFLARSVNVDLSGGERKLTEALQLGVLAPEFAVMDELDSGLDVDALRLVAKRVKEATEVDGLGVLAITHYNRFFEQLQPDCVHIFIDGHICESGGPELADLVEAEGYERWLSPSEKPADDPEPQLFTDPFGDPFADQLI